MDSGKKTQIDHTINIMVVGDTNVGKTNLVTRYTKNIYNEDQPATIGADFISKILNLQNLTINLKFWDTAGQEKYSSLARNFFKYANAIIFVYDLTDKETFKGLEKWITIANEECNLGLKLKKASTNKS